ncbi:peptidase [Streptomyces sp. NPDC087568]|uniref:COG1470 family protein n=1 Tax=Streptomyces sp. NPDC087568 TaxID=3365799 RepID=UPI00380A1629
MKRVLAILAAAGLFILPAAATAHPAPDVPRIALGIKLLEAPVERRDDPRASSYIIDHLAPGSTIRRRLEVVNDSSEPLRLGMYAGKAGIHKGRFVYPPDGRRNELAHWISLEPARLELHPHSTARVRATIRVPRRASEGERYGVIWAQHRSAPHGDANIAMVQRVGVRVYVDIGPGGEPASDFRITGLVPARDRGGLPRLRARVRNTGARAVDLSGRLMLRNGPDGLAAGPFAGSQGPTLAPGHTGEITFALGSRIPDGPWTAEVTLRSGLVEHTATGRLSFPDAGDGRPVQAMIASVGSHRRLWAGGGAALAALGLGVLAVRRRGRNTSS